MLNRRILAALTALSMLTGFAGCGDSNEDDNDDIISGLTAGIDMTVPDPDSGVGLIYYSPPEAEHIAPLDGDSSAMYIDNEVLLVAEDGVSRDDIAQLAEKYGASIVGEIEVSGDYQLRFGEAKPLGELEGIIDDIQDEDIVYSAELDYALPFTASFSGEEVSTAWEENSDSIAWGYRTIKAPEAQAELHKTPYTYDPVRVGLIDAGFDKDHEDLGFVETFYDNGMNGVNIAVKDKDHGTHVAGTMAATSGNGIGIEGVYPCGDGNLYGVSDWGICKYTENDPDHNTFDTAIEWKISTAELIVRNVKVINVSMGIDHDDGIKKFKKNGYWDYNGLVNWWNDPASHSRYIWAAKSLGDFLDRMLKKGYDFVIVNSGGNDSMVGTGHLEAKYNSRLSLIEKNDYPDVYDRIIVVGALDTDLSIARFSNGGERTDIYAPGCRIFSTVPGDEYENTYIGDDGDQYNWSGTSMASPHVAGAAAMVWTANSKLTGAEVKDIIRSTAAPLSKGCMMLDAYAAVKKAHSTNGSGNGTEPEMGSVLGFIVDKDNENIRLNVAKATITNVNTGEEYSCETDGDGHFEITAPEGDYRLSAKAVGYKPYSWSRNGTDTFHVSSEEVLYFDWIKMTSERSAADQLNWVVKPEIEADDILVGDRYLSGSLSSNVKVHTSPYVYIERDGKYGLIDYNGNIAVEPEYDSFNGNQFYGMDEFVCVYDAETGYSVFSERKSTDKNSKWEIVSREKAFGQPGIGTWTQTYFIDENDGEFYMYNSLDEKPKAEYGGVDASYIVQKINYDKADYGLGNSSATDERFYLYNDSIEKFMTEGYKYVYANAGGTCEYAINIPVSYGTAAFSNDGKHWDIYDYTGNLIASDLEPFDCNIDMSPWWAPVTSMFSDADKYSSAKNTHGKAVPFCSTGGYIAAKKDGKCGYIDMNGETVIDFGILEDIRPVKDGKAWVKYRGKWGVISFK